MNSVSRCYLRFPPYEFACVELQLGIRRADFGICVFCLIKDLGPVLAAHRLYINSDLTGRELLSHTD